MPMSMLDNGGPGAAPGVSRALRKWVALAAIVWAGGVLAGAAMLLKHDFTPGKESRFRMRWPERWGAFKGEGRPTLIMFAHPKCPCTAASLDELLEALASSASDVEVRFAFYKPGDEPDSWTQGANWSAAASIRGAILAIDPDGEMARVFGATTSGCVMFYDTRGELQFSGGITPSRGHEGWNPGRSALEALLSGRGGGVESTGSAPVFGCPLFDDAKAAEASR